MLIWILALVVGLVGYLYLMAYKRSNYWKQKGIPGPKTWIPIGGQLIEMARSGQGQGGFDLKWTRKLGRMWGYFDGSTPVLITSDTEMLKGVMVKDFSHFVNRSRMGESDVDLQGPVVELAVSELKNQRWKEVRSVLVPTFTSGKLRQMNGLINECVEQTLRNMTKLAETGEEFEIKKIYGTVTLDVIATTFFGTKIDSQNDPNNEFVKRAFEAFNFSFLNPAILIGLLFPKLAPLALKLGVQVIPKDNIDFFVRNTEAIMKMRIESKQVRRDFLQLMMNSLKGKDAPNSQEVKETVEAASSKTKNEPDIVSDFLSNGPREQEKISGHANYKLSTEEVVAQAIIFFLAGYETTATTLAFLTHLLAYHPEIQERLRTEIEDVMEGHEKPDFELIAKMEYLDMCVNETLRLFPPLARTERMCNEGWEYKGLKIEKGTVIGIPIFAIQRDPEFWPEPETFNPERFSRENKQKIKPYTFQTFGQGPRNCIGMRFAYYEIKMVIVSLLRNFRFVHSPKTQIPLILKDAGGFISPRDGIWITLEKLSA